MSLPEGSQLRLADEVLLGFTRAVRAAGLTVTPDRTESYLTAASQLGLTLQGTRQAGRATLCSSPGDRVVHDKVFDAWFRPLVGAASGGLVVESLLSPGFGFEEAASRSPEGSDVDEVPAQASRTETLRHRDIASMSAAERAILRGLFDTLRPVPSLRRVPRRHPHRRGEVDAHQTVRASLRHLGEPAPVRYRQRGTKPRKVVLLMDISGSMTPYADAVLRLAHRLAQALPGLVESWALGTRVTRVTAALRSRDVDHALAEISSAIPDWSGGTRLGSGIHQFLDRWGRPGAARGAVVVVFSDGWERGDTTELAEQVRRLERLAHSIIWVNPHRGKAGYSPIQQGIVAVLPHIDALVAGHSLAAFDELLQLIARS